MNHCEGCNAAHRPDDDGRCWYCGTPLEGVYPMPCNAGYAGTYSSVSSMSYGLVPVIVPQAVNYQADRYVPESDPPKRIRELFSDFKLELGRVFLPLFRPFAGRPQ